MGTQTNSKREVLIQQGLNLILWILSDDGSLEPSSLPIRWDTLIPLFRKNNILQYLATDLKKLKQLKPHSEIIFDVNREKDLTIKKNLIIINTLQKINQAAKNLPFDIVVLKGADLLANLYQKNMFRSIADIDIFIPVDKYELAVEFFFDLGYRFRQKDKSAFRFKKGRRKTHLIPPKGLLSVIDLHLALQTKSLIVSDKADVGRNIRTRRLSKDFTNLKRLDDMDRFVFNCDHWILHHSVKGLKWFIDLVLLFDNGIKTNVPTLMARAEQLGMEFQTLAALHLILNVLNIGIDLNDLDLEKISYLRKIALQQITHDFFNQQFHLRKVKSVAYAILSARDKADIFRNLKTKAMNSFDF